MTVLLQSQVPSSPKRRERNIPSVKGPSMKAYEVGPMSFFSQVKEGLFSPQSVPDVVATARSPLRWEPVKFHWGGLRYHANEYMHTPSNSITLTHVHVWTSVCQQQLVTTHCRYERYFKKNNSSQFYCNECLGFIQEFIVQQTHGLFNTLSKWAPTKLCNQYQW